MITTVIFDLDGLLADTEKLHQKAYQDVLGELGIHVSDQQYEDHWIRDGKGIAEFVTQYRLSIDPNVVRSEKAVRYRKLVLSSVETMPGALSALRSLNGHKTLALATSSYLDAAHTAIETLGIKKYFARIATKEDAKRMKPFPDIFLGVAEKLGVAPDECVVIEDAEKGILAAVSAGMRSIAIPNCHTQHNDFSKASMLLPSLNELTLDRIEQFDKEHPTLMRPPSVKG